MRFLSTDERPAMVLWTALVLIFNSFLFSTSAVSQADEPVNVTLPPGFRITRVADDSLATDLFCMTVDNAGRPVVSGPGYIRILTDENRDGRFDSSIEFATGPKTGAQGLLVSGMHLYCTGDGALWRYTDSDQNGVADGAPEKIIEIKTGAEHTAHAIRIGPDGCLYLIAGNMTPVRPEFRNDPVQPVAEPAAGFVMRFSPDLTERRIIVDGFRNAYDFDFNLAGELLVFDSDGERDISLPWYRSTRLYRMYPGDNAGWVSAGWKQPSSLFDMPETLAAPGRGSPTGVCTYLHESFGEPYFDATFFADWTFGRIYVVRKDGASGYREYETFASASGTFGFAVTDIVVEPATGALLVSVGGRGTRGGVYRIERTPGNEGQNAVQPVSMTPSRKILLNMRDLAQKQNRISLMQMVDQLTSRKDRSGDESTLAVRISMEQAKPVDTPEYFRWFQFQNRNEVRWILAGFNGREIDTSKASGPQLDQLCETLARAGEKWESEDGPEFGLWLQSCTNLPAEFAKSIRDRSNSPLVHAAIDTGLLRKNYDPGKFPGLISQIMNGIERAPGTKLRKWIRLGQLAFGACTTLDGVPPVYHGYTSIRNAGSIPPEVSAQFADVISGVAVRLSNEGSLETLDELTRLAAMSGLGSSSLNSQLVSMLNSNANVPADIHRLIVLSRSPEELTAEQAQTVAGVIASVRPRLESEQRNEERNWVPRVSTVVGRLLNQPSITLALIGDRRFLLPVNDYLIDLIPGGAKQRAIGKLRQHVLTADVADISSRQLAVVDLKDLSHKPRVIELCKSKSLQRIALRSLLRMADQQDVPFLVEQLASVDVRSGAAIAKRLTGLENASPAAELVTAVSIARRVGTSKNEVAVRDAMLTLISTRSGQNFGYRPGQLNRSQDAAVQQAVEYVSATFPQQYNEEFGKMERRLAEMRSVLESVDWTSGDVERGLKIFQQSSCINCHGGGNRMGPALEGITRRFSIEDIQEAIVNPDARVSDRYRAVVVETVDGDIHRGIVIYDSKDGVMLGDTQGETIRINREDIQGRRVSSLSAMPSGLADEFAARDWADLYAYLKSL